MSLWRSTARSPLETPPNTRVDVVLALNQGRFREKDPAAAGVDGEVKIRRRR